MSILQRIDVNPAPRRGGTIKVCYDFIGTGLSSVALNVEFDPTDGSVSLPLTPTAPCADVDVPDTAKGMLIEDPTGNSADWGSPVMDPL